MPDLTIENKWPGQIVVGVDEAGRGSLIGRVYAAAVCLKVDQIIEDIDDSKKLAVKKREELFAEIIKLYDYGVGYASVVEINRLNILEATKLACMRAVKNIKIKPSKILVDGNMKFNDDAYISIIGGDRKSLSIAAASIVAKVSRDQYVVELASQCPEYDWQNNKGYGTKKHIEAIRKYGMSKYHRDFNVNLGGN